MLTFDTVFVPLFIVAIAIVGTVVSRNRRVLRLQERARHDQQRFLRMGYLRKRARQEEQLSSAASIFNKGAR
jgi:hypothetical protein